MELVYLYHDFEIDVKVRDVRTEMSTVYVKITDDTLIPNYVYGLILTVINQTGRGAALLLL
jgi:hypothetical protein